MKVLITGGAGYLGCVVTRLLVNHVGFVTVVDTFMHRNYGILGLMRNRNLRVLRQDAFETDLQPYDCIINLAAIAGEVACKYAGSDEVLKQNYALPLHLADSLRDDQFMIQASTTAIWGDAGGEYIDYDEPMVSKAIGRYASSKLMADVLLADLPNVAIVRIPTLYGISPVMRKNILIHDLCEQAVRDRTIGIYGDIDARRPIGEVAEVAEKIEDIMRARIAGIYLLAAENTNKSFIASQIARVTGSRVLQVPGTDLVLQNHAVHDRNLKKYLSVHIERIVDAYRIML